MGCPTYENSALRQQDEASRANPPHFEEKEVLSTSSNHNQPYRLQRRVAFETPLPDIRRRTSVAGHRRVEPQAQHSNSNIPVIARNAAYPIWLAPFPRYPSHGGRSTENPPSSGRTVDTARPDTAAMGIPTTAELRESLIKMPETNDRNFAAEPIAPMSDGEQKREFFLQQRLKDSQKEVANLRKGNIFLKEHLQRLLVVHPLPGFETVGEVDTRRDDARPSLSGASTYAGEHALRAFSGRINVELIDRLRSEVQDLKIELNKAQSELVRRQNELELKDEEMKKVRAEYESTFKQEHAKLEDQRKITKGQTQTLKTYHSAYEVAAKRVVELSKKLDEVVKSNEQEMDQVKARQNVLLKLKDEQFQEHVTKSVDELAERDAEIPELKAYIDGMDETDAEDTTTKDNEISNKIEAIKHLKKTIENVRRKLEDMIEEKQDLREDLTTMSKEKEELQESLNFKNQLVARATAELKRRHEELSDPNPGLERKTKELKAKDDELIRQVQDTKWCKNQLEWYKNQFHNSQHEIENKTSLITQLSSKTHDLDLEVSELNNKSSLLLKRLKGAEQENENLKGRIAALRRSGNASWNQRVVSTNNDALSMAGVAGSQPDSDATSQASDESSDATDDDEYHHVAGSASGDESYTLV